MNKVDLFTAKGLKKGTVTLPRRFSEEVNMQLLAQAIRVYSDRIHPGLSKTKTRGEVTASTRKIYRQKGTGSARHGAISAPIFVGGGKVHGPTGIKRELTLPRKMKVKATNIALSKKVKESNLILVDGLSTIKKTAEAQTLVKKILANYKLNKKKAKVSFILSDKNSIVTRALRNLKNAGTLSYSQLNAYNVFSGGLLILDKDAIEKLSKKSKESGRAAKPAGKKKEDK